MTTTEHPTSHHPIVAFVGPSLPLAEAVELFPQVHFLPPVCQGDFLSAWEMFQPEVMVILDGEFGQSLSVWHKEILFVIDKGVHVVGASSMGALRAAELERFGMIGVGEVFRHYSGAFLTADEDVALIHGDPEWGWQAFTWPLVNCRATVAALVGDRTISADDGAAVLAALSSLHFSHRVQPALATALAQAGHPRSAELAATFALGYVDQKKIDAIAGLERGLSLVGTKPGPREEPLHLFGRVGESMWEADTLVPSSTTPLRRYQLVNDIALHHTEFEALSQRTLDRQIALEYAFEIGIEPTKEQLDAERARFLGNRNIADEALSEWLTAHDLSPEAFDRLIRDEAVRRRMQRWVLDTKLYGRNRKAILDQLRIEGGYPEAVRNAARRRSLSNSRPPLAWPRQDQEMIDIILRHHVATGWRAQVSLELTAEDHGFEGTSGFVVAMLDATAARQEASERRANLAKAFGIPTDGTARAQAVSAPAPTHVPADDRTPALDLHRTVEMHQFTALVGAAVELRLFDQLHDQPSTADLAPRLGAVPERLERLCIALRAAGLLTGDRTAWTATASGALLAEDHQASLAPYLRDLRSVSMRAWAALPEVVQGGTALGHDHLTLEQADDADRAFSAATWSLGMDLKAARLVAPGHTGHIVDVGGGLGRLALALAAAAPSATVSVVERPSVIERSRRALAGSPIAALTIDTVTQPIDDAFLTRVMCTLDDTGAAALLLEVAQRLSPTGRIHIIDTVLDGSMPASLVDLFNLVRTGGGARTTDQWHALVQRSGLVVSTIETFSTPFSHIVLNRRSPDEGALK